MPVNTKLTTIAAILAFT